MMSRSRLRFPRRTVRLRLTLLYSLLFLIAGGALLAITYLLVRSAGYGNLPPSRVPPSGTPSGKILAKAGSPKAGWKAVELKAQVLATRSADLHQLLTMSGIALVIMALLSVVLGWLVAGRVLQPLRTMTTTTQRISERNLNERLALRGPSDEIKELADTIDGLLQRLEAAFDAQRRFVANASHELRTPLTLDRALLDVTLADPDATVEDLRAMGKDLIASGEQQQELIEALLTLAISSRGLEHREPFDLAEITNEVLLAPHPGIHELDLDLQTTITPAPTNGDPRLANRLVTNLFDNALRHNIDRGHVNIATRSESGVAVLSIANSGPVIAEDDIDRLFQPFQRLRRNRAYQADGYGLGLSIVQAIVAAHAATIGAHALPDGGLHIEVRFPGADT